MIKVWNPVSTPRILGHVKAVFQTSAIIDFIGTGDVFLFSPDLQQIQVKHEKCKHVTAPIVRYH